MYILTIFDIYFWLQKNLGELPIKSGKLIDHLLTLTYFSNQFSNSNAK